VKNGSNLPGRLFNDSLLHYLDQPPYLFHQGFEVGEPVVPLAARTTTSRSKREKSCWCGMARPVVSGRSNPFSARVSSSPFFLGS
jgi:hypothetical protein